MNPAYFKCNRTCEFDLTEFIPGLSGTQLELVKIMELHKLMHAVEDLQTVWKDSES